MTETGKQVLSAVLEFISLDESTHAISPTSPLLELLSAPN